MANKLGFQIIDGKPYIDGVEIATGGGQGQINNTFNKICIYGTSIEVNPTGSTCWPKHLADALGLTYGTFDTSKQVVNYASGGGGVTWYGTAIRHDHLMTLQRAFSCTSAEKEDAAAALVSSGVFTQEEIDEAKSSPSWNSAYDQILLGQNADLYIFSTYGINDRSISGNGLHHWTDEYNEVQTAFTVHSELAYDPRTIYGAYNRVLRALYNENPNAKVVILGQHTFQWSNQDVVNGIQRAVAERWQIPFANWGYNMSLNDTYKGATNVTITFADDHTEPRKRTIYNGDDVHPNVGGGRMLGQFVADWISHVELKPLNERFTDITHE